MVVALKSYVAQCHGFHHFGVGGDLPLCAGGERLGLRCIRVSASYFLGPLWLTAGINIVSDSGYWNSICLGGKKLLLTKK